MSGRSRRRPEEQSRSGKNFNRIVSVIIMAIITAEVLAACGVKPEDKEGRAKDALEQKYQQEFEITQVYPQKFGELYYEVQAYPVQDPQLRFTASIDTEDSHLSDTYVERLVCQAISRQVEENLDNLPGYYTVFTHAVGPQPITDNREISIADYAALDPYNRFQVELFVKPEEASASSLYSSLTNLFHGLEYLKGGLNLFLVSEEQMEEVQAYFEQNDTLTTEYTGLTGDLFTLELSYDLGRPEQSEQDFAALVRDRL